MHTSQVAVLDICVHLDLHYIVIDRDLLHVYKLHISINIMLVVE